MGLGAFDLDQRGWLAAFAFHARQTHLSSDDVLPRSLLVTGFTLSGTRLRLPDRQWQSFKAEAGARVRRGGWGTAAESWSTTASYGGLCRCQSPAGADG